MIASAFVSTAALMKSAAGVSAPSETTLYPAFSSAIDRIRLPTMCVSEPMTSVLVLDIDVLERAPAPLLLADVAQKRIRERNHDEDHDRAADRSREENRPVVLIADHAGHERAFGLRAQDAAEH